MNKALTFLAGISPRLVHGVIVRDGQALLCGDSVTETLASLFKVGPKLVDAVTDWCLQAIPPSRITRES